MELIGISKYILAVLLITAGILHFLRPRFFMKLMPDFLPAHRALVLASGIVEIICGVLLLFSATQTAGAYLTILLLVAVFPANVEMSRQYYRKGKKGFWLTILRLPLQILLIWWAFKLIQ